VEADSQWMAQISRLQQLIEKLECKVRGVGGCPTPQCQSSDGTSPRANSCGIQPWLHYRAAPIHQTLTCESVWTHRAPQMCVSHPLIPRYLNTSGVVLISHWAGLWVAAHFALLQNYQLTMIL